MELIDIIILGVLQGLTEFLPVSSSGHLVIAQYMLGIKSPGNTLEILFQYTFKSKETGTTWRFTSKRSKNLLVGNPVYDDNPYRECLSKQKMESELRFVLE